MYRPNMRSVALPVPEIMGVPGTRMVVRYNLFLFSATLLAQN